MQSATYPVERCDGRNSDLPITRIVALPHASADLAFHAAVLSPPEHALQVHSVATADHGRGPVRRIDGCLRSGRGRIPVEIELAPWSHSRSELTLRPVGGSRFRSWRRYLRNGNAFMDALVAEMRLSAQPEAAPVEADRVAAA
jgi:hypothetical protein